MRWIISRVMLWFARLRSPTELLSGRGDAVPNVSGNTLVMVVQAVDAEIRRLRALPDHAVVPGDEMLLVDYENAAEELEEAYAEAASVQSNLPPYSQLVRRRE